MHSGSTDADDAPLTSLISELGDQISEARSFLIGDGGGELWFSIGTSAIGKAEERAYLTPKRIARGFGL